MREWNPLTADYVAANGLVVEVVRNEDVLRDLGVELNNGLQIDSMRAQWADMCVDGKRQIVRITRDGSVVANAELRVRRGQLDAIFVRGNHNVEYIEGAAEFDAVAGYINAVNNKTIPLNLNISDNGFVGAALAAKPDAWEIAQRAHLEQGISPFAALIEGINVEDFVDNNTRAPFEELTWTALSGAFSHNDVVISPVGSRTELRNIGEEVECMLFFGGSSYIAANAAIGGHAQFASIKQNRDIIGYVEFKVYEGNIVPVAYDLGGDRQPSREVLEAVEKYCEAVNNKELELSLQIFGSRFYGADEKPDLDENAEIEEGFPMPTLGKPIRSSHYENDFDGDEVEEDDDEDGYYDDDGDFHANQRFPERDTGYVIPGVLHQPTDAVENPLTWEALTETFVAPNGLVVKPITDQESLRSLGAVMNNALANMHYRWANFCVRGDSQIVAIIDRSGDAEVVVANAELHSYGGVVSPEFNRGPDNQLASLEANAALDAYCAAVNEKTIELKGTITESGFEFEAPDHGMKP